MSEEAKKPGEAGYVDPKEGDGTNEDVIVALEDWYKDYPPEQITAINDNLSGMRNTLKTLKTDKTDRKSKDLEREAADKKVADELQVAADAKLVEDKKFEELSTQRQFKLEELGPKVGTLTTENDALKATNEKQAGVIKKHLEAVRASLELKPAMVTLLDQMTPVAQLEFIAEHGKELGAKNNTPAPPSPVGSGNGGKMGDEEKRAKAHKTTFS